MLFSMLLFVGLFTGSLNCRFTQINHAPQRTGSRAVFAQASLSEIAERAKRSAPSAVTVSRLFLLVFSIANPITVVVTHFDRCERLRHSSDASLWLTSQLFRPPPVPSLT